MPIHFGLSNSVYLLAYYYLSLWSFDVCLFVFVTLPFPEGIGLSKKVKLAIMYKTYGLTMQLYYVRQGTYERLAFKKLISVGNSVLVVENNESWSFAKCVDRAFSCKC